MKTKAGFAIASLAVLCAIVTLTSLGGKDEIYWQDQYGNGYRVTTHDAPRGWSFMPLVHNWTHQEALHSDGSWVLEGPSTHWSRAGKKLEEGHYRDGKREGQWNSWREDGTIDTSKTGVYENDLKVGD